MKGPAQRKEVEKNKQNPLVKVGTAAVAAGTKVYRGMADAIRVIGT